MARTSRKHKKQTASDMVEPMLNGLSNSTIENLATDGLDEPTWNEPTGYQFLVDENGTILLDLDLKATALVPLEALLAFHG